MAVRTRTVHEPRMLGGDAKIEDYLDKKGVRWAFQSLIGPDQFDFEKSLRNQARIANPLDESRVVMYTEAMRRGDQFPPVIAYGEPGKYVIVDGNHRLAAARAGRQSLSAYIISGDSTTIVLITFEANTRHGLPTSEEERTQHALFLLDNGSSIPEAAAAVSLPKRLVEKASIKRKANQRFIDSGLPLLTIEKLSEPIKARLMNIKTDAGFKAAAELVVDAGMTSGEVFKFVTDVNDAGNDSEPQVRYVREMRESVYADRIGATGGGVLRRKITVGPKAKLGLALANIGNLPEDLEQITTVYVGPERDDMAKRMRASARRLNEIAKALSS